MVAAETVRSSGGQDTGMVALTMCLSTDSAAWGRGTADGSGVPPLLTDGAPALGGLISTQKRASDAGMGPKDRLKVGSSHSPAGVPEL